MSETETKASEHGVCASATFPQLINKYIWAGLSKQITLSSSDNTQGCYLIA